MSKILDKIDQEQRKKEAPANFEVGDMVSVHVKIREGDKERIQLYKGTVIAKKGKGATETFTVRRISYGEGVERLFPMHSPSVVKVDVERPGKVRRAKLYYLRDLSGKESRIKERTTA